MNGNEGFFSKSGCGVILAVLTIGCNNPMTSDGANAPATDASQRPFLRAPTGPAPAPPPPGPRGAEPRPVRERPSPPADYLAANSQFVEQSGIWGISRFAYGCWAEAPTKNGFFRFVILPDPAVDDTIVHVAVADARWSDLPKSRYVEFIGETLDQHDAAAKLYLDKVEPAPELGAGAFKFAWSIEGLVGRGVWEQTFVLTPAGGPAAEFSMVGVMEALHSATICARALEP